MSEATRRQFALSREPCWGFPAITPSGRLLRFTGRPDINPSRSWITSEENRQDRETPLGTAGANSTKVSIGGELSYGSYDDLLEAALFGRWLPATGAQPITLAVSCAVAATGKTFTRASGSFLTDGFAVGDFVIVSGFVNAANNGAFKITALSATVMTLADALPASGVTLVDETLATGAIFDRWNGLPVQLGATTLAVAATGKTFTRSAGSFLTDGLKVGDYIVTSGFATAGNNGSFKVTTLTALVATCAGAVGLVDEAAKASCAYKSGRDVLKAGTLRQFFDLEQGQMDFATLKYKAMRGAMVDQFKLTVPTSGKATVSFDLIGFGGDTPSSTPLTASPTAQSVTPIINTCIGSMTEDGVATAIATDFSLQLANNGKASPVLFQRDPGAMGVGARKISGKVAFRFTDRTREAKYFAETQVALAIMPTDPLGNKYVVTLPAVKYTSTTDEGDLTDPALGLAFEAGPDATLGTSLQIERIPA